MDSKVFCVYNLARGVFLCSKVTVADNANQPLKILNIMVSGFALQGDSGLWLTPLIGPPAVPRLFPFDLVYLDKDHRILNALELIPGIAFPPYSAEVSSALVLPLHTMRSTQTGLGDRLIICVEEEMDRLLAAVGAETAAKGRPIPIDRPKRGGGVAPSGEFSWIKFSDETATGPDSGSRKSSVFAGRQGQIASKTAERKAGNGQTKAKLPGGREEKPPEIAAKTEVNVPPKEAQTQRSSRGENQSGNSVRGAKEKNTEGLVPAAGSPQDVDAKRVLPSSAPTVSPGKKPTPRVAITEVVIEGPKVAAPVKASSQVEDGADLFSNWVVSPSMAPEWIEQKTDPFIKRKEQIPASKAAPDVAAKVAEIGASIRELSRPKAPAVQSRMAGIEPPKTNEEKVEPVKAAPQASPQAPPSKQTAAGAPVAQQPRGGRNAPTVPTDPTRASIRPASQTTSFTVSPNGMWHVSPPTAAGSVVVANTGAAQSRTASAPIEMPHKLLGGDAIRTTDRHDPAPRATEKNPVSDGDSSDAASIREALKTIPSPVAAVRQRESERLQSGVSTTSGAVTGVHPETPSAGASAVRAADTKPQVQATAIRQIEQRPAEADQVLQPAKSAEKAAKPSVNSVVKFGTPATSPAGRSSPVQAPGQNGAGKKSRSAAFAKLAVPGFLKAEGEGQSLATRFRRWLSPDATPSDRRRAQRRYVPGMVAHYYTGGAPTPHEVADISMSGFYILTDDRWMPETMIQMTLQKPTGNGERKQSITVLSRIVRRGSDGVGLEFVMPDSLNRFEHDVHPSQTTDRFALARFL